MKPALLSYLGITIVFSLAHQFIHAQNTSPYWSLAGNTNSTANSRLGTRVYQPLRFMTNDVERMRLASNGLLGINTATPAVRVHIKQSEANRAIRFEHNSQADYWNLGIGVNTLNLRFEYNGTGKGQVSSIDGSYSVISDRRLKEDIEDIGTVLDRVLQLQPKTYYIKNTRAMAKYKSIGLISEEAGQLFPELVQLDDDGYKWMNYAQFSVVAIKAIQEQQAQIDELKAIIRELQPNAIRDSKAWMKQNTPNPSAANSTIQYFVPDNVRNAKIILTNSLGQQLSVWTLNRGQGFITLHGNTLKAGNYQYSLVTDGKTMETRKLIIAR